jgi:hypothetical protein
MRRLYLLAAPWIPGANVAARDTGNGVVLSVSTP